MERNVFSLRDLQGKGVDWSVDVDLRYFQGSWGVCLFVISLPGSLLCWAAEHSFSQYDLHFISPSPTAHSSGNDVSSLHH